MFSLRPIQTAATIGIIIIPSILYAKITMIAPDDFVSAAREITVDNLPQMILSFETNPARVASYLESEIAGPAAARNYITAMLVNGQAERLGRQWKILFADAAALSEAEEQDGGVWFPRAEDAGFLTGVLATVLASHSDKIPVFARGADMAEPTPGQDTLEWLAQAAKPLTRPARSYFQRALLAGAALRTEN